VCLTIDSLTSSDMSDPIKVATGVPFDLTSKLNATGDTDLKVICRWNFDDDSIAIVAPIKVSVGSPFMVSASHLYQLSGVYKVSLEVIVGNYSDVTSVNIIVLDRIGDLIVGNNGPTLLGQPTFVEAHCTCGANVQFGYRVINESKTTAVGVFDVVDDDHIRGVRVVFNFTEVGRHIVQIHATNDVSNSSTFTVVRVINESSLEIVGLASSVAGRYICGLPLNTNILLTVGVVHWNVSSLMFAWSSVSSEMSTNSGLKLVGRTSGVGLQQVRVQFTTTGVYRLTIKVGDMSSSHSNFRSAVYQLCANETAETEPPPITLTDEYTRLGVGVTWPTSPYVPLNRKVSFFQLVPFDRLSAECVSCVNLIWSFYNYTLDYNVIVTGRTPSNVFRQDGVFIVTVHDSVLDSGSNGLLSTRSAQLTVVVVPEIEFVAVRFVSSSFFETIVGVNSSAKFFCSTLPRTLPDGITYTWAFYRDDSLTASNDVIVTQVPEIVRSFDEAGNWTITVSVANQVTVPGTVRSASTVLQVQYPITGLAIDGCCKTVLQTNEHVEFHAVVLTGSIVNYSWQLKRIDPLGWNITNGNAVGPILNVSFGDAGRYRVGLTAENYVSRETIVDEFIVQVGVLRYR